MRHAGGAERYVAALRDGLTAAGDEVRLLTSSAGSAGDGRAEYVAWSTGSRLAQSVLQIANPWAAATARRAARELAPEAVLVNMFANHLSPAVLAPLAGLPTLLLASDFKLVCPTFAKTLPGGATCRLPEGRACLRQGCLGVAHWLREQPRYVLLRRAARGATRVLACSATVRRELERNGIPAEVVPLPVDPPGPAFRRAPAAAPRFVFAGRLATQKGIFPLLRAFARLRAEVPAARLRFVGDGPERAALERAIAEHGQGSAVEVVGWVPWERVEDQLADAWALIAPTLGPEPLGLTVLEAIVRGVPVVATRNGGFLETVEEGRSGLLVGDGDEDDLLRALRAVAGGAFPDHRVAPALVSEVRARHDPQRHVATLRAMLSTEIDRRRAAVQGMP